MEVRGSLGVILGLLLAGCSTWPKEAGENWIGELAGTGFEPVSLSVPVNAWKREPISREGAPSWHLFIEGDGSAWRRGGVPSLDPTPQSPVALWLALELAREDKAARVAYLGRPCQWFASLPSSCHPALWTDERYGEQAQQWLREAIEAVASDAPVRLVGFSGGAHLALQLAPMLPSVEGVISVAGNLDDGLFAQHHRLPRPAHVPEPEADTPLWSLSGGQDRILPAALTESMLQARGGRCQAHRVEEGAAHTGPWRLDWPSIEAFLAACQAMSGTER
jgi:pimeloyl-ACP methyl ester carboxylesterase